MTPVGIPEPRPNLESLVETLRAVIEQVQVLTGQRGLVLDQAVTRQDLLDFQLLEAERDTDFTVTSLHAPASVTDAMPELAGWSVAEVFTFRRAVSAPATPTGGSYNFSDNVLTPPASWGAFPPAGADPVWVSVASAAVQGVLGVDSSLTWSAPVRVFSDGQAVDMVFKRSLTQPSTPADSVGVPATWYTDVGSVPASSNPLWSSVGTRQAPSENWVWQTPIQVEGVDGTSVNILGELANTGLLPGSGNTAGDAYIISGDLWVWNGSAWINVGAVQGPAGTDGVSVAEIVIYKRSATAPAGPSGGSFNFATRVLTVPSGWSEAPPAGTDPVYVSLAVAASSSPTGSADLTGKWSTPVIGFQNGADGKAIDAIFQRSASQPAIPSPSAGTPAGWYSSVDNVPANSNPLWMSVGTRATPTSNWVWQVPVRVEGAEGAQGADGALAWGAADFQMGSFGDVQIIKNEAVGAVPTQGNIRILGSRLYFRGSNYMSLASEFTIDTPYQPSGRVASVFYVFANRNTTASSRFGASFPAHNFFVAEYNAGTGAWLAIAGDGSTVGFTPASTDAVIAIGSRPSAADLGVRTIASFVTHITLDAASAPIFIQNAAITSALIETLTASKIAAGNLVVAMNITTGSILVSSTGAIYSDKAAYGAPTAGWFLGRSAGLPAFDIGNATQYLRFRPDTGLEIGGDVIVTGNLKANAVTVPTVTTGSDVFCSIGVETTILETASIPVSGGGAFINAFGQLDSGTSSDLGLTIRIYADTGSGYVLRKTTQAGIRTSGGDTYFKLPMALTDALDGVAAVRVKLTGEPFVMTNASVARSCNFRDPVITVLGVKR